MSYDERNETRELVILPYRRIKANPSTVDLGEPSGAISDWKSSEPVPLDPKTGLPHRCISHYTEDHQPIYYQDTKEGKEWARWAYKEFLRHEFPDREDWLEE